MDVIDEVVVEVLARGVELAVDEPPELKTVLGCRVAELGAEVQVSLG